MTAQPTKPVIPPAGRSAILASQYTFDQLANIYNQARVDYIVPMPMNGKRMAEYVRYYDIILDGSFVSLNEEGQETGVAMLGLRGDRAWITRLGVLPHRRGKHIGQFLMENLLHAAEARRARLVQLEVIVGNEPAHRLFRKLGFEFVRELLVIRRPPGIPPPNPTLEAATVTEIDEGQILFHLEQREAQPSWIDETASLLNAGSLRGVKVEMPTGDTAWAIFQRTPFQLTHFAVGPYTSDTALQAVLYHVHREYAMQDTKIENIPADSPMWSVFASMGYFEVFRRAEMVKHFGDSQLQK